MTDLHKEISKGTFPCEYTLDDVKRLGIAEAAEDEDCYYIHTSSGMEDYSQITFWMIDKKTKRASRSNFLTWIFYIDDALDENRVKRIDPPFDTIKLD